MASFECPFPLGVAVEYVSKAGLGSLEFSYNIGKIEFWNYGPYSGVCYGYFVRKNRVRIQRTAIASACLDLSYEQQFICWFGMTIDTLPGEHVGLCWCFPVVVITWCAEGRDVISTVTSLSYGHNYVFLCFDLRSIFLERNWKISVVIVVECSLHTFYSVATAPLMRCSE